MTTPRRFSKHPSSWGQKESLGLHRLSFGINTKYTSVFGKSKINATTNKGTVAAVSKPQSFMCYLIVVVFVIFTTESTISLDTCTLLSVEDCFS